MREIRESILSFFRYDNLENICVSLAHTASSEVRKRTVSIIAIMYHLVSVRLVIFGAYKPDPIFRRTCIFEKQVFSRLPYDAQNRESSVTLLS